MPFQRSRTKSSLVKTSGDTISIDSLDIGSEDSFTENIGNLNLKPRRVDSIKTTNEADTTNLGTNGQFILLVGQNTIAQNGLYEQGTGTTTKQHLTKSHYFLDTAGIRAIFNQEVDRYKRVYIDNIHLYETFTTTTAAEEDVFDILVKSNTIALIDLEVIGIKDNATNIFHGSYKRSIYNRNGAYVDGEDHFQLIKIKGTFPTPTINFDMGDRNLKITPGDNALTTWFIKGKLSM